MFLMLMRGLLLHRSAVFIVASNRNKEEAPPIATDDIL
jgi:hypothetical protein